MPSTAEQGFQDPYNFNNDIGVGFGGSQDSIYGYSGVPGFFRKLMGYDTDMEKEMKLTQLDREYERASIQSARAWDEYMDSTQYQRRVKDLEAAGLNPWLAVQNGISGSGQSTADTGGSAKHSTNSGQSGSGLAGLLMALAKLVASA